MRIIKEVENLMIAVEIGFLQVKIHISPPSRYFPPKNPTPPLKSPFINDHPVSAATLLHPVTRCCNRRFSRKHRLREKELRMRTRHLSFCSNSAGSSGNANRPRDGYVYPIPPDTVLPLPLIQCCCLEQKPGTV
jgi:hypothetical protein